MHPYTPLARPPLAPQLSALSDARGFDTLRRTRAAFLAVSAAFLFAGCGSEELPAPELTEEPPAMEAPAPEAPLPDGQDMIAPDAGLPAAGTPPEAVSPDAMPEAVPPAAE